MSRASQAAGEQLYQQIAHDRVAQQRHGDGEELRHVGSAARLAGHGVADVGATVTVPRGREIVSGWADPLAGQAAKHTEVLEQAGLAHALVRRLGGPTKLSARRRQAITED